jgi:polyprenyl-phospho-N-acetylgalactosaminyl synthase
MIDTERSSIFVIIPAYNEASQLRATVKPVLEEGYSVVVVDDGSTDDTAEILSGLPVHLLRHPVNLGQGAALQTGGEYALREDARVVVHFDADGQHSAAQIHRLIAPILEGAADVVLGSRFLDPADAERVPRKKRVALRIGKFVSFLYSRLRLSDTHNGFRALSREAMRKIAIEENGFAHATEILRKIRDAGLRWIEAPAHVEYTPYSIAKGQRISNGVNIVWDLMVRRLMG